MYPAGTFCGVKKIKKLKKAVDKENSACYYYLAVSESGTTVKKRFEENQKKLLTSIGRCANMNKLSQDNKP